MFIPDQDPGTRGQERYRIPDPDPQHWLNPWLAPLSALVENCVNMSKGVLIGNRTTLVRYRSGPISELSDQYQYQASTSKYFPVTRIADSHSFHAESRVLASHRGGPGSIPSGFRIRIDLMRIRIRIRIQHFF
jgi:hypothetical protein